MLRFDNTAKGITKLLRHLAKQEATLAVCEPTGGYERLLVSRLRKVEGEIRRFYQNLRQRGKPGNVALVAVMRKLLLQLNALARRGTPWVPLAA